MIGGQWRWRGQDEHPCLAQPFLLLARHGAQAHHLAPGIEAGERQDAWLGLGDARPQRLRRRAAQRIPGQLMIHAIDMLGDVGEADAMLPQHFIFVWGEQARRQADRVQRGPELVLAMRIVGLLQGRDPARRRAAEHQLESRFQPVGKNVFRAGH